MTKYDEDSLSARKEVLQHVLDLDLDDVPELAAIARALLEGANTMLQIYDIGVESAQQTGGEVRCGFTVGSAPQKAWSTGFSEELDKRVASVTEQISPTISLNYG